MKPTHKLWAVSSLLVALTAGAQTWTGQDVGNPGIPGSHTGTPPGQMTVTGGGADIWGTSDQFYYVYTTVDGHSWDAKIRVHDLQGPDWWTKCELMVRVPDASGLPQGPDPFIAAMTTRSAGQNQVAPQWRASRGGDADWNTFNQTVAPTYPNTWLRLTRQGSVITMWYGTDGVNWTKYADIDTASTQFGFGQPFPGRVLVGVAVTAHNNADLGTATVSDLSVTVSPAAPNLQVVRDLQNQTVYSHTTVTLTFQATNAAIANGSLGVGDYQWFKNGQPIANATGPTYSFVVAPEDNNAQIYCRAVLGSASVTSTVATLTVQAPTEIVGMLKWEYYPGVSLFGIRSGAHGRPAQIRALTAFDGPQNFADNYASRISGLFVPPVTGDYVFFIAADDDADLYLGTNASPASKRLIAQQEGWSGRNNWITHGG
ncbi:MAG: PA14 domain-containing protein, partial [Limisphaera sp.]